jgi:hypothetical protein
VIFAVLTVDIRGYRNIVFMVVGQVLVVGKSNLSCDLDSNDFSLSNISTDRCDRYESSHDQDRHRYIF